MKTLGKDYEKLMRHVPETVNFQKMIHETIQEDSELNFANSIVSLSHFLERYALDGKNFKNDIKTYAKEFEKSKDLLKNTDKAINLLEKNIESLLSDNYPTRYFSFLKAQCYLHVEAVKEKQHTVNQMIDFSKTADVILKQDDYTQSIIEMFARTFESFLYDKLAKQGKKSSVLADNYNNDMYQQGNLKENIDTLWDKMWSQMKTEMNRLAPQNKKKISSSMNISLNIEEMRKKYASQSQNANNIKI